MPDFTAYFNGEWVPLGEVRIAHNDRGFMVADAIFDAERTFDGKIFRLKEHIDRLYRSLQYVRIDPGLSPEEMAEVTLEAVRRNDHLREEVGDFTVHQFVTRGPGRWSHTAGPPTVCVKVAEIDWGKYASLYKTGGHCVITRTRSYSGESLDPKVKHYSRMNFNLAELEAGDVDPEGFPLLTDLDGNLTEGTGQNVFVVTDGVLRTPQDRTALQGMSRGMVFDLARQLNIPVVEEDLQPYDLYTADEAFMASSNVCILPLTKADNRQVGDGRPGEITQQLLAAWSETVGVDIVGQMERFDVG